MSKRRNYKYFSLSPNIDFLKKNKYGNSKSSTVTNSCPPRYEPKAICSTSSKKLVMSESDSNDDPDKDPTWEIKNKQDFKNDTSTVQNSTDSLTTNKHSSTYIMSPIGKISVETDSMHSQHNAQNMLQSSPSIITTAKRVSFMSEPTKSNLDFQQFVINTLTKIKYDLTLLTNTLHASQMSLETFFENSLSTSAHTSHVHYDPLSLDELFLIMDDESFNSFEKKVQMDKNFRSNVVSNLALLVGIKDVGDSIRRIMSKMFSNEFRCEYSLLGF